MSSTKSVEIGFYYEDLERRIESTSFKSRTQEELDKMSTGELLVGFAGTLGTVGLTLGSMIVQDLVLGTSSAISPVTYMAGKLAPDDGRPVPIHGNWCGKNYPDVARYKRNIERKKSEGSTDIYVKKELAPIDLVDYFCAIHDVCYDQTEDWPVEMQIPVRSGCDLSMSCAIRRFQGSLTPSELLAAQKVIAWGGHMTVGYRDRNPYNRCVVREYDEMPIRIRKA